MSRMPAVRARALLLGAFAALVSVAAAAGADESAPSEPTAAAWRPSGVGEVTSSTYPEGTLHVGALAGQETDRTYLRFEPAAIPEDATVDRLTVRITVADDAGTSSPEVATILACAVPDGFDPEAAEPAATDCDGAPEAAFAEGVFTVELTADGEAVDVALVPAGSETWHVGFREATAVVSYAVAAPVATTTTTSFRPTTPPVTSARPALGGPVALPPITVPPPSAAGEVIADQATQPPPIVVPAAGTSGSRGFRYPAVFALPLALLVVVGIAGDGLTRPVRLREDPT